MEKKRVPWWLSALAAALFVLFAAAWIMRRRSALNGLDIMLASVLLVSAAMWAVRALRAFPERKNPPWWVYMLTAIIAAACVLAATWIMLRRERLDGLDVMLILAWWAVVVTWTVRAVRTFPGRRKNDTATANDNKIINGGDNHD